MRLVLTRRQSESVIIRTGGGDRIRVGVALIKGDRTRLAFDADRSVEIHREELLAGGNGYHLPLVSIGPGGLGHPDSREIGGEA